MGLKNILLLVLVLIIGFSVFLYNRSIMKTEFTQNQTIKEMENLLFRCEVVEYPSYVEVTNPEMNESDIHVGMSVDPWELNFGALPLGSGSKKYINIANYEDNPRKVRMISYGNISSMIRFSENNIVLRKGDEKKITIFLNTSLGEIGNYTGEVDAISKESKYSFLNKFVRWF